MIGFAALPASSFRSLTVASVAPLFLLLPTLGCNAGPEPTTPNVAGIVAPYKPPQLVTTGHDTHVDVTTTYNMYYGDTVRQICKGPDPFFAFDAAQPDTAAQPTLQTLATCMLTGPLKDRRITLIGRTDPRGSEEYNEKLGLERAERVKRYSWPTEWTASAWRRTRSARPTRARRRRTGRAIAAWRSSSLRSGRVPEPGQPPSFSGPEGTTSRLARRSCRAARARSPVSERRKECRWT